MVLIIHAEEWFIEMKGLEWKVKSTFVGIVKVVWWEWQSLGERYNSERAGKKKEELEREREKEREKERERWKV